MPLQFPLHDVVITTDATPHNWAFYFQVSGLPLFCCGAWSGSMCKVHIAFQELQAISLRLHKMAYRMSHKVVALHLDNGSAEVYLCKQGDTASLVLFRLTCHILNLADRHGITFITEFIPTHLNVESISPREGWFWHSTSSLTLLKLPSIFGISLRWICWHPYIPINVSYSSPWKSHYI